MPIYEYQCTNCNYKFDLLQKINDSPILICPKCSNSTAQKLVSSAGFQLKGSGWYATDFKDKGKPEKESTAEKTPTESKTADTSVAKKGEAV